MVQEDLDLACNNLDQECLLTELDPHRTGEAHHPRGCLPQTVQWFIILMAVIFRGRVDRRLLVGSLQLMARLAVVVVVGADGDDVEGVAEEESRKKKEKGTKERKLS